MKNKKVVFIIIIFLIQIQYIFSIKFLVNEEKKTYLQAIIGFGTSLSGVTDVYGLTDYESIILSTAFHAEDFGIGFKFNFRFKMIFQKLNFYYNDWYVQNDDALTVYALLDKIDYTVYGDNKSPIYFKTGQIPYLNFGNGLLVNDFHNNFFIPTDRENGFYTKFDGNYLNKRGLNSIPISFTYFITDMADPDTMGIDSKIDIMQIINPKGPYNLFLEQVVMFNFNATESNRLSNMTLDETFIDHGNYRNMAGFGYNTGNISYSVPINFVYSNDLIRINPYNELTFITEVTTKSPVLGIGDKLGCELRFINLKDSGFLVGTSAGLIFESENFIFNYYGTNYEIVRKKQYLDFISSERTPGAKLGLKTEKKPDICIFTGFSLYGLNDNIQFHFFITMPTMVGEFSAKFHAKFVIERLDIKVNYRLPELYMGIYYDTGLNVIKNGKYPNDGSGSNGGYFIYGLTDDFRFSTEIGFKYLVTKIGFLIGIQKPQCVYPVVIDKYNTLDMGKYKNDLESFMSLEVSFVF